MTGLSNIELLPAFSTEAPACSLEGSRHAERAREFQAVFAWLRSTDRDATSLRWVFQNGPGVERHVRELARKEHACCPFLSFAISTRGDEVIWQARAFDGAELLLDAFAALPETVGQTEGAFERLVLRTSRAHC